MTGHQDGRTGALDVDGATVECLPAVERCIAINRLDRRTNIFAQQAPEGIPFQVDRTGNHDGLLKFSNDVEPAIGERLPARVTACPAFDVSSWFTEHIPVRLVGLADRRFRVLERRGSRRCSGCHSAAGTRHKDQQCARESREKAPPP